MNETLIVVTEDGTPWAFSVEGADFIDPPKAFPDTPIVAYGWAGPVGVPGEIYLPFGKIWWSAILDHGAMEVADLLEDEGQDEWTGDPRDAGLPSDLRRHIADECLAEGKLLAG